MANMYNMVAVRTKYQNNKEIRLKSAKKEKLTYSIKRQ